MNSFWIHSQLSQFTISGPDQQYHGQAYPPPPPVGFNPGYNPAYPHQIPNQTPNFTPPSDPSNNMYNGYQDPEADAKNFSFTDESVRRGFIRKVYSILCVSFSFIKMLIDKILRSHSTGAIIDISRHHWPLRISRTDKIMDKATSGNDVDFACRPFGYDDFARVLWRCSKKITLELDCAWNFHTCWEFYAWCHLIEIYRSGNFLGGWNNSSSLLGIDTLCFSNEDWFYCHGR